MRSYSEWASLVRIAGGVASLRAFQQGVSSSEMDASAACGTSTLTGAAEAAREAAVLLCDPYTFPVDGFLTLLQREWRGALAVGGLASGGWCARRPRAVVRPRGKA